MVLDEADVQINLQKAPGLIFLLGLPEHRLWVPRCAIEEA